MVEDSGGGGGGGWRRCRPSVLWQSVLHPGAGSSLLTDSDGGDECPLDIESYFQGVYLGGKGGGSNGWFP